MPIVNHLDEVALRSKSSNNFGNKNLIIEIYLDLEDKIICQKQLRRTSWATTTTIIVIIKNNKKLIIHKFSVALFPAERAQRACSHTCA